MRTVLFLLVLLTAQTFLTTAQNFAPVGAKWHYTEQSVYNDDVSYSFISSVKDTVFEGKQCRKLYNEGHICAWHPDFVYDSNDSVFYWHPDREEFCLLYDFGAQPGDTWEVHHLGFNDSTVIRVDSIDMEIIDNEPLKVLYTTNLNQQLGNPWSFKGKFIERVGAENYLFPILNTCDPPAYLDGLRCYRDSVISVHQEPYECDEIISSISENHQESYEMKVYPNPAKEYLIVRYDVAHLGENVTFELLDVTGRPVLSQTLQDGRDEVVLDLRGMKPGSYAYRVVHLGRLHYSGKVVVSDR